MRRTKLSQFMVIFIVTLLLAPILIGYYRPTQEPAINVEKHSSAEFISKNILFDESHAANGSDLFTPANASMFSWILRENGYNSSTNFNDSLDSGILASYDILVIFFPMIALSGGELTAIQSFVSAGGGLLLVGADNINSWDIRVTNLNPLSENYDISFNADQVAGYVTSFTSHNITGDVTKLSTFGDEIWGCTLSVTGTAVSVVEKESQSLVAVAEAGLGRVACVGMAAPFYMYRHGTTDFGDSHFQFSVNIIDWVAGNPQRTANIPEIATITVGNGPDLSPSEVDEYHAFVGLIHDHTLHSDGHQTPEVMVDRGASIGLDYMVLTDHSWSVPVSQAGITGALAAKAFAEEYGLDCQQFIGAEASAVYHTVGFPLTDNIWSGDQQVIVDEIHAQGGIAILCHPTLTSGYADVYVNMESYGYDAVEVDNSGFFHAEGETGFNWPFVGASDGHDTSFVGQMLNVAFVKNPTGPNGQITDVDLKEAILDKRIVILDRENDFVYGQRVWVDGFFDLWEEAPSAIESARTLVDDLKTAGEDVGLSEAYLEAAQAALDGWNPARALRLVSNATSQVALGIHVADTTPSVFDSDTDSTVSLAVANNHSYGVAVNSSLFTASALSASIVHQSHEIASTGSGSIEYAVHSSISGLPYYLMILRSFNTTEYLMPVVIRKNGVIDNVYYEEIVDELGHSLVIQFGIGRSLVLKVTSTLIYDDGGGQQELPATVAYSTHDFTLGPYTESVDITFHIRAVDPDERIFNLQEHTVSLTVTAHTTTTTTTTTATTTTTTTTPTTPTPWPDMTMGILVAVISLGVILVIVIIVRRR